MRGWKPISFEQYKKLCCHVATGIANRDICDDNGPYSGCECCASFCQPWRRLGRADIKVIKISTDNKHMPKLVCPKCGATDRIENSWADITKHHCFACDNYWEK